MEKEPAAMAAAQEQAQAQAQEQWQGAVEATLPSTPASAAWPHIASFCALHRYLPDVLDVCELAEGEDGRPGCIRYLASLAPGTTTGEVGSWAREKLLEMDHDARRLTYAVVGSNMGFGRYVATMSVVDVAAEEEKDAELGCRLVWAFECDPVQGWTRDGFLAYLDASVKGIAARIEEAAAAAAANGGGGDGVVVVAA